MLKQVGQGGHQRAVGGAWSLLQVLAPGLVGVGHRGVDGLAVQALPAPDAAAFLETRTNMNGVMVECVTPLRPLLLEPGLSRRAARAFTADYAAIGLETCLRLVNGNS